MKDKEVYVVCRTSEVQRPKHRATEKHATARKSKSVDMLKIGGGSDMQAEKKCETLIFGKVGAEDRNHPAMLILSQYERS